MAKSMEIYWKSIGNLWQNLWKSMAKKGNHGNLQRNMFTNWISLGSPMVHHDTGMESGFHLAALVAAKMQGVNT